MSRRNPQAGGLHYEIVQFRTPLVPVSHAARAVAGSLRIATLQDHQPRFWDV
jgi:hypothetical protein